MTTKDAFTQKFCPKIRTGFNWSRFKSEDWPIEIVTVSDSSQFAALRLPWCLNPKNEYVSFAAEDAVRVRLSEVEVWFAHLPAEIRADIERYEKKYRHAEGVVSFDFPAYAIPKQQYLVLDGNHRLSALTRSGVPFRLQRWA